MKKHAFTLVELIVVITIVTILGTIGLVSFLGYAKMSRDSLRIADMSQIDRSLNVYRSEYDTLPLPGGLVSITVSGAILNYQGYANTKILSDIKIFGGGMDPVDDSFYTYSINVEKNQYQLLGYFEAELSHHNIAKGVYADYQRRYPKTRGDHVGIILHSVNNSPIQDSGPLFELTTSSGVYRLVISDQDKHISGGGKLLEQKLAYRINKQGSCEALFKNEGKTKDGIYTIYPTNGDAYRTYCDMSHGGWTALFSVDPAGTTWSYNSEQWRNPLIKEDNFLTNETTFESYQQFTTRSIKICRKDIDHCYTMNHNKAIPLQQFFTDNIRYIDFSEHILKEGPGYSPTHSYNRNGPENIGIDRRQEFVDNLAIVPGQMFNNHYNKNAIGINIHSHNKIGYQGDNNNSWPGFDNLGAGIGVFRTWDCGWDGRHVDISRNRSIGRVSRCVYNNPDTEMWYVLAQ